MASFRELRHCGLRLVETEGIVVRAGTDRRRVHLPAPLASKTAGLVAPQLASQGSRTADSVPAFARHAVRGVTVPFGVYAKAGTSLLLPALSAGAASS